jgi:integrase
LPLTEAQLLAFKPDKKAHLRLGNALYLLVAPQTDGEGYGRYFVGRFRFQGKQGEVRIGPYGKGDGRFSRKEARDRWEEIRQWARENKRSHADWKREERAAQHKQKETPTLGAIAEQWLTTIPNASTRKDYANKLHNQILPQLGTQRPITDFTFDNSRREILKVMDSFKARGKAESANRAMQLMRNIFDLAIDEGWLHEPNAAGKSKQQPTPRAQHHPSLSAEELPLLFKKLEEQSPRTSLLVTLALKLNILTFLRVSALVSLQWAHLDKERTMWTIPGETKGLKRGAGRDGMSHLVPITPAMAALLAQIETINGNYNWAFYSPRGKIYQHINPSSINKRLKDMGYEGLLTAHGFRRTVGTIIVEKLGFSWELFSRQAGHLHLEGNSKSSKLRLAYDGSQFIDERRRMLECWHQWCLEQGLVLNTMKY